MMDIDKIPKQIRDFNFVLNNGKQPIEKEWPKIIHGINDPILQQHLSEGKNYGVQSNNSFVKINGIDYVLVAVDFDKREFQDQVINKFPETFTTTSGSEKKCVHLLYACNKNQPFKVKDENLDTLADVIGAGNQIIAPGSKHPSGSIYTVVKDVPISFISYAELEALLKPYDKSSKTSKILEKPFSSNEIDYDLSQKILNSILMNELLQECGIDSSKNPTNCPFHSSRGGRCLSWNNNVIHCFHCEKSWNKFSLVREAKKLTSKETFDWLAAKAGLTEELKKSREEYNNLNFAKAINTFTNKLELADQFIKIQPIYYERKNQFWVWDFSTYSWIEKDETDILNLISQTTNINTVASKERSEILEALKQKGRLNRPLDIKPTWVQFKNKIYDIETGENFEATPQYFVANPINWKVGDSEDTPTIDKLMRSWVKEEDINKLYEFLAFITVPKYFIHSFHFLYGVPGTAKSTFTNLAVRFVGDRNHVSTSLDRINNNARFETYNWHKKLLITLSEVSNVNDLKNSGLINQATGEDPISAEVKGGSQFNYLNYGKFIYPTNKLLKIDTDDGLGRRIRIIKFNTRFEKEKDVLTDIPESEFENLAKKSLRIAKELWDKRQFTGDVTISERMQNYQEQSKTPLEIFINKYCDLTDSNARIHFDEFYAKFVRIFGQGESRIAISKQLRINLGFEVKLQNYQEDKIDIYGNPIKEWTSGTNILGIKWKEDQMN